MNAGTVPKVLYDQLRGCLTERVPYLFPEVAEACHLYAERAVLSTLLQGILQSHHGVLGCLQANLTVQRHDLPIPCMQRLSMVRQAAHCEENANNMTV